MTLYRKTLCGKFSSHNTEVTCEIIDMLHTDDSFASKFAVNVDIEKIRIFRTLYYCTPICFPASKAQKVRTLLVLIVVRYVFKEKESDLIGVRLSNYLNYNH